MKLLSVKWMKTAFQDIITYRFVIPRKDNSFCVLIKFKDCFFE